MASRVGTYLSDENIKRMCVIDQMSPGSKTYGLYKLSNSTQRAQRSQNVSSAMLQMSKLQKMPYQTLVQTYENSIRNIPNESVLVYTPSTRIPQSVLDARGRVGQVESIVRPAGTGASSRPLIQGASVVLGTVQPVEGQFGVDVSVNTPSPSSTSRARLLAEQQTGTFTPDPSNKAKANVLSILEGKGPVDELHKLTKRELRFVLEELGGQYTGQRLHDLAKTINSISDRIKPPIVGTPVKDVDEAGPSETPTFDPEQPGYTPTRQEYTPLPPPQYDPTQKY